MCCVSEVRALAVGEFPGSARRFTQGDIARIASIVDFGRDGVSLVRVTTPGLL